MGDHDALGDASGAAGVHDDSNVSWQGLFASTSHCKNTSKAHTCAHTHIRVWAEIQKSVVNLNGSNGSTVG